MTPNLMTDYNQDPAITLTYALLLITELRLGALRSGDHASFDAWTWATGAVRDKRDWWRGYNARSCAPWFEHKPTQPTDDQGDR